MKRSLNVVVFMGYQGALAQFHSLGILQREMEYFRELSEQGVDVTLITHDRRGGGLELAAHVPDGVRILGNRYNLSQNLYYKRVHQIHGLWLARSQVVKTWNPSAMAPALRTSWAWGAPLVLRWDFDWSASLRITNPDEKSYHQSVEALEREALEKARRVIATSQAQAETMREIFPGAAGKTTVLPNHVDENLVQPMPAAKIHDLVFVGRIHPIKNLEAILAAVERLDLTIAMVAMARKPAEQACQRQLLERFGDLDGRIRWLGRAPNEDLPEIINQARAFVLCSHSEGNPRALIEAMSCGMPVIGSRVRGISSLIEHGRTGWLCEPDAESIAAGIKTVLDNPALMATMGENARRYAVENCSMRAVARREYELLHEVARQNPVASPARRVVDYALRRR